MHNALAPLALKVYPSCPSLRGLEGSALLGVEVCARRRRARSSAESPAHLLYLKMHALRVHFLSCARA